MDQSDYTKIKDSVLGKIHAGDITMKPRLYFTARLIALSVVLLCILVVSSIVLSYILFSVRTTGELFLLGFGTKGILAFLLLFPWFLLVLDLALIVIFQKLIKHFKFGYTHSFIFIFACSASIVVVASVIINTANVHRQFLQQAEQKKLPVMGGFYNGLRRPIKEQGIFRGTVVSIKENTCLMQFEDESYIVVAPQNFPIASFLHIGDSIFVAGVLQGNTIQAYGIKKTDQDF